MSVCTWLSTCLVRIIAILQITSWVCFPSRHGLYGLEGACLFETVMLVMSPLSTIWMMALMLRWLRWQCQSLRGADDVVR